MTDAGRPRGSAALRIGLGLGIAAALGLALWLGGRSGSPGPDAPLPPAPDAAAAPAPARAPAPGGTLSVDSGGTLVVAASSLSASAPLVIELRFPEPSADAAPRPVRVNAPDGRLLELEAPLAGEDRRGAVVEIPPQWLSPGRYVVEIRTTELSHFPLRRYVLEVE